MATESFANNAFTSVYSGGTDAPVQGTTETWIVTSSASFPVVTSPATEFHVADPVNPSETIAVTNTSGVTWTVTRGAEGSTPVAHAAGFTVSQVVTAGWLNSIASSSDVNSLDWINVANAYGADPTGNNWSDGAFASAASAATFGTVLYVPYGTYKAQDTWTIAQPGVTVITDPGTVFNFWGPGDFFRMYSPDSYTSGWGGGLIGRPVIDGTHAPAGACGAHIGDIYQLQVDFGVRNFQGANSKGVWFDNQYWYAEDMSGRIWAERNTANVVFDHSANAGGNATGSFARLLLDIVLDAKGVGDGLVIQSDADLYGGRITYVGNMDYGTSQFSAVKFVSPLSYSFTATNASPCVFTAAGSYYSNGTYVALSGGSLPAGFTAQSYFIVNASGDTFELAATSGGTAINSTGTGSGTVTSPASQIRACTLQWDLECNGTSNTYQPVTISFGTQAVNQIRDCTGLIDFTANNAFASAVNWTGSFQFDGICLGDPDLMRVVGAGQVAYSNGVISNGAFITTRYNSMATVAPSGNVTGVILGTNDPGTGGASGGDWANTTFTLVNSGTGSVTFAASGTSHVATGTACVVRAGCSMTFAWIANSGTWYPLQGSVADTTAADIQPAGVQAAGANGLWADSGHVHQNYADLSLYLAPTGATAETFTRTLGTGYLSSLTSELVYVSALALPEGEAVSNITLQLGNAQFTLADVTHGWYALLDSSRVCRAVSADQTSGNWGPGSANSAVTLSVAGSGYTTTYGGLYYVALCITFTSTSGEFVSGPAPIGGLISTAPVLCGTSSTGQTTPPTAGVTTLGAITAVAADRFYAYTS